MRSHYERKLTVIDGKLLLRVLSILVVTSLALATLSSVLVPRGGQSLLAFLFMFGFLTYALGFAMWALAGSSTPVFRRNQHRASKQFHLTFCAIAASLQVLGTAAIWYSRPEHASAPVVLEALLVPVVAGYLVGCLFGLFRRR